MEKPKALPLREPEFIKLPTTRMISKSWEKFWLLMSSSHAAVTDTTSGLMLFSCSSNCSLNRMASSLIFSCFTVDIWQVWRGWDVEMRHFPYSMHECVLREYSRGFFLVNTYYVEINKDACVCFDGARILLWPTNICGRSFFSSDASFETDFLCSTCGKLHWSQLTGEVNWF